MLRITPLSPRSVLRPAAGSCEQTLIMGPGGGLVACRTALCHALFATTLSLPNSVLLIRVFERHVHTRSSSRSFPALGTRLSPGTPVPMG
jgi:hypothetical protein